MTYRNRTDRRYQDWHYTLPRDWSYIDLDGLDWCPRCREGWLLTEITRNPEKATTVLGRLSRRSGINAVLILLPETLEAPELLAFTPIRWRFINPPGPLQDGSMEDWRAVMERLRDAHMTTHENGA